MNRIAWAAPVAGAAVGLVGALVLALTAWLGLPPLLRAGLSTAALVAATGALHEDGLADVADGFGGGSTRERKLEIMRDSRIGAQGAAALTLLLIAKVAALAQLAERRDLLTLLAFPTIARWLAALLVVLFPYARPEGLGRAFSGEAGRAQAAIATGIAAVAIAVLGTPLILPALGTAAVVFGFAFWLHRRLGGLTGDVYGAAIELGEVTMLFLCSVR